MTQPKPRILVADDEPNLLEALRLLFDRNGFEVLLAQDGQEAVETGQREQPDVIILDLQMPTVDGFTVLQELNVDGRTSVIPVIVSTSLNVNAELKARIPAGTRVISKNTISRENVSLFLRDATQSAP